MKNFEKQKGFTLIEAMVGIAIFSIGFLAVASMQISALNSTTSSRKLTEAMEIATREVERLHGLPFYPDYDDKSLSSNERFTCHPDLAQGETEHAEGIYTIRFAVEDNKPLAAIPNVFVSPPPNVITISKTITVTVFETRNPGRVTAEIQMVKVWEHDA